VYHDGLLKLVIGCWGSYIGATFSIDNKLTYLASDITSSVKRLLPLA